MPVQIHTNLNIIGNFWVGMVKNGSGQSGDKALKLSVSKEWTNGMNEHFDRNWQKLKVD